MYKFIINPFLFDYVIFCRLWSFLIFSLNGNSSLYRNQQQMRELEMIFHLLID